jgi:hypothetical protein
MESETLTRDGPVRSEIQKENCLETENCIVLFFNCSGSHQVSFVLFNFFHSVFFFLYHYLLCYICRPISYDLVVTASHMARGHTGTGLLAACLRLKLIR